MTDFLRLNGIPLSVRDDNASGSTEEIGDTKRAIDATLLTDRRALKRSWALELLAQDAATAEKVRSLIWGEGHVWSFNTSLYSSKGRAVSVGAGVALSAVQSKFGGSSLVLPNTKVFTASGLGWDPNAAPWTASFWWWNGTVWQHVVESSAGRRYENGVDVGVNTITTTSTDTLEFTNTFGVTGYVDDLWVVPFAWPATWPAFITAYAAAVGASPWLVADGLFVKANASGGVVVKGSVDGEKLVQAHLDGSWQSNLTALSVKLVEV